MQNNDDVVSVGEWIVTFLILAIPFVNFIAMIYWAFSPNTKPSKSNFAKAYFVLMLVLIIIAAILLVFLSATAPSTSYYH